MRKLGWTLGLLAMSCARPPPASATWTLDAEDAALELKKLEAELAGSFASPQPDCARDRALTKDICALADRICSIGEVHPDDAKVDALCKDSRPRCEGAREKTRATCGAR